MILWKHKEVHTDELEEHPLCTQMPERQVEYLFVLVEVSIMH